MIRGYAPERRFTTGLTAGALRRFLVAAATGMADPKPLPDLGVNSAHGAAAVRREIGRRGGDGAKHSGSDLLAVRRLGRFNGSVARLPTRESR